MQTRARPLDDVHRTMSGRNRADVSAHGPFQRDQRCGLDPLLTQCPIVADPGFEPGTSGL
jgi:hypothetical protein